MNQLKGGEKISHPFSSKGFLQTGGVVLIALGILSYLPIANSPLTSVFGTAWWFDGGEGIAHLVSGIIAIIATYILPRRSHKLLVAVVGIIAALIGLLGGTVITGSAGVNFYGLANLEFPLDNILNLLIAAWAFYAFSRG